jgi:glutaredoxin
MVCFRSERPSDHQYISQRGQRLVPQIGIHHSKHGTMFLYHTIRVKNAAG